MIKTIDKSARDVKLNELAGEIGLFSPEKKRT